VPRTERHHARSAGASRRAGKIVRVARRRRAVEISELGGCALPRTIAGNAQATYDRHGDRAGYDLRARLAAGAGRMAGDIDQILDGDGNSVQGPAYKAGLRLIAQNVGRGERAAPRRYRLDCSFSGLRSGKAVANTAGLRRLAARTMTQSVGSFMRANAAISRKAQKFSKSTSRRGSLCLSPAD
jgi:hypothetical protein